MYGAYFKSTHSLWQIHKEVLTKTYAASDLSNCSFLQSHIHLNKTPQTGSNRSKCRFWGQKQATKGSHFHFKICYIGRCSTPFLYKMSKLKHKSASKGLNLGPPPWKIFKFEQQKSASKSFDLGKTPPPFGQSLRRNCFFWFPSLREVTLEKSIWWCWQINIRLITNPHSASEKSNQTLKKVHG